MPVTPPLVSILIPAHNSGTYVAETLESALSQTWRNKEIIVVEDGSSDDTAEVATRFLAQGIVLSRQSTRGAAAARNVALAKSSGQFIQYLDADDLLQPDKIALQMELLLRSPPGTVASSAWGRFTGHPAHVAMIPEPVWRDMLPVDWLVCAWNGGGMMQTACWLTPRALMEEAGPWDESLRENPADDGEFFCRVLLKSSGVRFCAESTVYYRSSEAGTLSRQNSRQAIESLLGNCESYERNMFAAEDSARTRQAVATNYARFVYLVHPRHPDLLDRAHRKLAALGVAPVPVGGAKFKALSGLVGFKSALKLRTLLT